MRSIAAITWLNMRLLAADRTAFLWMILMPVAFTFVLGIAFSGRGGSEEVAPEDVRYALTVADLDPGPWSDRVLAGIAERDEIDILMVEGPNAAAEAARLIDEGDRSSALVIPADFSERIASGGRGKLVFHRNPGRTNPQATRATLDRVLARMNIELTAVDAAVAAHSELWGEPSPTAEGRISSRLEGTLAQAWAEPHLSVQFERLGRPTGSDVPEMGFQHSSPAITLMYVLLNGLMLSVVLVEERRLRTLSRLFTAPVRRSQLIAANLIWRFVVAALQSTILVVIGSVAFRVDWGDSALALAAVLAAFAASVAGLSVLIGSLARTTRQAHSAALVVSLSMSAIGGLWWPLEVTPETYQTVGHLAPTAWAMDALHDLVSRGDVLAGVLPEVWVLLGFAAVFSVAATLAFRPE